MALDLENARRQLEKFLDQSKGGWMTDEAGMTALVIEMKEAGLIDAAIERDEHGAPFGAIVHCVTREGLDFLEASAKPALWQRVVERGQGRSLRDVVGDLFASIS